MASPVRPSPGPGTQPVQRRFVRFTNTAVPRFNGDTCWYQHKQVSDVIVNMTRLYSRRNFGDVGPSAQIRMVWDQFITGHHDCDLKRHLDSVPPVTPIRDIVDRCRVWESHSDTHDHDDVAPTVTGPQSAIPIVTPTLPGTGRYSPDSDRSSRWF